MATGPEMLIATLVKVLKLDTEVEKVRSTINQALAEDLIGQVRQALEKVSSFDERLARIEQAVGINGSVTAGSSNEHVGSEIGFVRHASLQLANGTDN
jgi:hypothetical protein